MSLTPEQSDTLKKAAVVGAGLALAGIALRNREIIGDKIRFSSFWEASQTVVVDIIGDTKDKLIRLAGTVVRDAAGEVVDVELDESLDYTPETVDAVADAFPEIAAGAS